MNDAPVRGFWEDFEKRRCMVLGDLMVMSRQLMGEHAVDYRFQLQTGLPFVFPAIIGSHGGLALIGDFPGTQADFEFGPGLPLILKGALSIQWYLDPDTESSHAWALLGNFGLNLYKIDRLSRLAAA
jgi:hypothetical protein